MAAKHKDPQDLFAGSDFVVTKTLFEAPALSFLPNIFQDEKSRRWAVAFPGAVPAIFAYGDLLTAELVEEASIDIKQIDDKKTLFKQILTNPGRVSRAGAGADGRMSPGMTLRLSVESGRADDGVAELAIPIITRPVRKSSFTYRQLVRFGENLRDEFLAMRDAAAPEKVSR